MTALAVALAVARDLPARYVAALAIAAWAPWVGLIAVLTAFLRGRRPTGDDAEVAFLASLTAHLDAGQSLRGALVMAAESSSTLDLGDLVRAARAGLPMSVCARALGSALPTQGHEAATALTLAAGTGGSSSAVFEMLTSGASAALDLRRDLSAGTAGARFSVLLLGGGPLILGLVQAGNAPSSGPASVLLGLGGTLVVLGATTTWLLVRRAVR